MVSHAPRSAAEVAADRGSYAEHVTSGTAPPAGTDEGMGCLDTKTASAGPLALPTSGEPTERGRERRALAGLPKTAARPAAPRIRRSSAATGPTCVCQGRTRGDDSAIDATTAALRPSSPSMIGARATRSGLRFHQQPTNTQTPAEPSEGGGGLMSCGPDLEGAFYSCRVFLERILKGARPADLPIEQATTFQLPINQRAAKALAFRLPQRCCSARTR